MTKKIDAALKDLTHALERHAQIVGLKPVPQKKAGRAAAELRSAATAYASIVEQKTGFTNPFIDVLDTATIDSLVQERDALAKRTAAEKAEKAERASAKDSAKAEAAAEKAEIASAKDAVKAEKKDAAKRAVAEADAERAVEADPEAGA